MLVLLRHQSGAVLQLDMPAYRIAKPSPFCSGARGASWRMDASDGSGTRAKTPFERLAAELFLAPSAAGRLKQLRELTRGRTQTVDQDESSAILDEVGKYR